MEENLTNGGSWIQDDIKYKDRLAYGSRAPCTIPPPFFGDVGDEPLCGSEIKQLQYGRQG
jgi:hypothetical protein